MTNRAILQSLTSQYRASLQMLRSAILACPPEAWDNPEHENRTWRLAYHVLWGVRFYLSASPEAFVAWEGAIENAESLGAWWEDPAEVAAVEEVHTPQELIRFLDSLLDALPAAIEAQPLDASSGFEWYPFTRFELHLNTIRHVQHHTGQLIERLRSNGVTGFAWH